MMGMIGFTKGAQLLPKPKNIQFCLEKVTMVFMNTEPRYILNMFFIFGCH